VALRFFLNIVFLFVFGLINDSISQQQGTEAAIEFFASRRECAIPHGA
jgi:hypothetical protein